MQRHLERPLILAPTRSGRAIAIFQLARAWAPGCGSPSPPCTPPGTPSRPSSPTRRPFTKTSSPTAARIFRTSTSDAITVPPPRLVDQGQRSAPRKPESLPCSRWGLAAAGPQTDPPMPRRTRPGRSLARSHPPGRPGSHRRAAAARSTGVSAMTASAPGSSLRSTAPAAARSSALRAVTGRSTCRTLRCTVASPAAAPRPAGRCGSPGHAPELGPVRGPGQPRCHHQLGHAQPVQAPGQLGDMVLHPPMGSYATQAGVRSRGSNTEHRRSTRSRPLMLADSAPGPAARQAAAPRPPKAAVPGGRRVSAADRTVRSPGGSAAGSRERRTGHRVRGPDRCRNLPRSHDVGPGHARAFGPRCPSLAPCSVNIVCEVIKGAGPNGVPGRPGAGRKD